MQPNYLSRGTRLHPRSKVNNMMRERARNKKECAMQGEQKILKTVGIEPTLFRTAVQECALLGSKTRFKTGPKHSAITTRPRLPGVKGATTETCIIVHYLLTGKFRDSLDQSQTLVGRELTERIDFL